MRMLWKFGPSLELASGVVIASIATERADIWD